MMLTSAQCGVVQAQTMSGYIGVYSKYLDDDLFVYTDQPVVQAEVYLDVTDHCSLDVWGSHGIATSVGGELDLGGSCRFALTRNIEIEIATARILLRGNADLTSLTARLSHGPFEVMVERYFVDQNPDATRIVVSYSVKAAEKFTIQPYAVHETGFGEANILVSGVSADFALTARLSLVGTLLVPIARAKEDIRSTQAIVGIQLAF